MDIMVSRGAAMIDLPDRHSAEDVEEDKTAVRHILTQQVPVAQTLNVKIYTLK